MWLGARRLAQRAHDLAHGGHRDTAWTRQRHDTPGRLAEWGARTGLDPARWTLLAGDAGAVREVAAVLGVRYQAQADGELAHTNAITVLDRAGAVVHQQVGLGAAARCCPSRVCTIEAVAVRSSSSVR